jgi:hypothetical protein
MSSYPSDQEQLLDYEDELQPPAMMMEPVPVRLTEPAVTLETVPQHAGFRTIVLTADNPFAQLLPPDPLRVTSQVYSPDHDVVLASSAAQAQDKANISDTSLLRPNGALLASAHPTGIPIDTTDAVWVAGPTYPSRVSVIVTRRPC